MFPSLWVPGSNCVWTWRGGRGIRPFCTHRLSVLGSLFQAGPREHSESVGREEKNTFFLLGLCPWCLALSCFGLPLFAKFCASRFLLTSSWDWDTSKTLLKDKGANTFPYPFLNSSDPASVWLGLLDNLVFDGSFESSCIYLIWQNLGYSN